MRKFLTPCSTTQHGHFHYLAHPFQAGGPKPKQPGQGGDDD